MMNKIMVWCKQQAASRMKGAEKDLDRDLSRQTDGSEENEAHNIGLFIYFIVEDDRARRSRLTPFKHFVKAIQTCQLHHCAIGC